MNRDPVQQDFADRQMQHRCRWVPGIPAQGQNPVSPTPAVGGAQFRWFCHYWLKPENYRRQNQPVMATPGKRKHSLPGLRRRSGTPGTRQGANSAHAWRRSCEKTLQILKQFLFNSKPRKQCIHGRFRQYANQGATLEPEKISYARRAILSKIQ